MMDQAPEPIIAEVPSEEELQPHLPTQTRADGSLVIDLSSLATPPTECLDEEPDPFQSEIVVCRQIAVSPRLGANYGPTADELLEGSAVPRARVRLSEDAEAQANVIEKGVGGWDADGVEAKVKIDF